MNMNRYRWTLLALLGVGATLSQASAAVPSTLVGEWRAGEVSTSGYVNNTTGAWRSARSNSFTLTLAADGSYQYVGLMLLQSGGCESKIFNVETGRATFNGNKISLNPTGGDAQYYLCDPNNVKKGTLKPTEYQWTLAKDSAGKEALYLTSVGSDDRRNPFYRQGGKVASSSAAPATKPAAAKPAATKPAAAPARTISGTISAAGGHSLKDTVIIACPNGDCEAETVKGIIIDADKPSATFTLKDLDNVPYAVYAVQDNDGDEDVSVGDWVDRNIAQEREAALVKVGTSNVRIELVEVK